MSILKSIIQVIYNHTLRRKLPYKIGVYNGIPLYKTKLLDKQGEIQPNLEDQLVNGIKRVVSESDSVVIVGGGYGVSSVTCGKLVGPEGEVTTYEAGKEQARLLRRNIELNDVHDRVEIKHAAVGPALHTFSEVGNAERISPQNLPDCDVLVMDCEGAERKILSNIRIRPRGIVVETHTFLNSPPDIIAEQLNNMGYEIQSREYEDPDRGVEIITAIRSGQ